MPSLREQLRAKPLPHTVVRLWGGVDVTVRALPPGDYEALVAQHPPSADQLAAGRAAWDVDTFPPALLEACVTADDPPTAAEWADMLEHGPLSQGEAAALVAAAVRVNDRSPTSTLQARFDADGLLCVEMAVCERYRMPHSQFMAWDADDRDKAVEWHLRQAETCSNCGTRPQEWDPERGGDWHAYHADFVACRGCEVKARGQDEMDAAPKGEFPRGSYVVLRR